MVSKFCRGGKKKCFISAGTQKSCPSIHLALWQTPSLGLHHGCENATQTLNVSVTLLLTVPAQSRKETPAGSLEETGNLCFSS